MVTDTILVNDIDKESIFDESRGTKIDVALDTIKSFKIVDLFHNTRAGVL